MGPIIHFKRVEEILSTQSWKSQRHKRGLTMQGCTRSYSVTVEAKNYHKCNGIHFSIKSRRHNNTHRLILVLYVRPNGSDLRLLALPNQRYHQAPHLLSKLVILPYTTWFQVFRPPQSYAQLGRTPARKGNKNLTTGIEAKWATSTSSSPN